MTKFQTLRALFGFSFIAFAVIQTPAHAHEFAPATPRSHLRLESFDPSALSPNADFPYLTVQVGHIGYDGVEERAKLEQARRLMETVLNSEALKQRILAHTWQGKLQFADNRGRSNTEIYESIRRAIEESPGREFVAEFDHTLYTKHGRKVGYTLPPDPVIHTNTKYFYPFSISDLAGHLTHEWTHLLGYVHQTTFPGSVPYDVGDMVAEITAQIQ